jgi:prolyl oligopeptidase
MVNWKSRYPTTLKQHIEDDYFGTIVQDPYRWLEDPNSPESQQFTDEQNKLLNSFINQDLKQTIHAEFEQLFNFPRYTQFLEKKGDKYFFWMNTGLQNQPLLYSSPIDGAPKKIVLDPNSLSTDGTVAVTGSKLSRSGSFLAYFLSIHGSDWQQILIKDLEQNIVLSDVLRNVKFTDIAWLPDDSGFYYSKFPENSSSDQKVFFHTLGTDQSEDQFIYKHPTENEFLYEPVISQDGKYLLFLIFKGTMHENRVYYKTLHSQDSFTALLDKADAKYVFLGNHDKIFFFYTTYHAPKGKIIAIDIRKPAPENWQDIVAEDPNDVIEQAILVNQDYFVLAYMHNAYNIVKIFKKQHFITQLDLPLTGSVISEQLIGQQDNRSFQLLFTSFCYPPTVLEYSFEYLSLKVILNSETIPIEVSNFETKQIFFPSKDGTTLSMFLTYKKDLKLTNDTPVILYGYGGFNIPVKPTFSLSIMYWLNYGIFAAANLRGGNEYGIEWYKAGILERKQNVFHDFQAAAEWLIKHQYTNSNKLVILGGSNGGLLVATSMVQRPDLFAVVICQAPVIDMLRYHKFTIGKYWISEYGNPDNPDHFKFLYKYSPLQNIKSGVSYPALLILVADTDDRVVPAHGKKLAATLQELDSGKNPLLIRIETKAGHGLGKPVSKIIEELTIIYSFILQVLQIQKI